MKAVLISIQPKWCEKIASGEKMIEVRKTRPKLETPFKVYIYCTKEKYKVDALRVFPNGRIEGWQLETANIFGKYCNERVLGEFVCDRIYTAIPDYQPPMAKFFNYDFYGENGERLEDCLTSEQLSKYGDGSPLYGWHISQLKIYDKPKELSEFKHDTILHTRFNGYKEPITRPPQSWCYVEELQNG